MSVCARVNVYVLATTSTPIHYVGLHVSCHDIQGYTGS